jgi:hypothetical protein
MSTNTAGLSRKKVTLAMGFAIAGGVLIITSSLLALLTLPSIEEEITGLGIRDPRLMEEELITDYLSTTLTLGLISGIILLIVATMMYFKPGRYRIWGIITIVFSIIALLAMSGFVMGTVLGIIGGILAILRPIKT